MKGISIKDSKFRHDQHTVDDEQCGRMIDHLCQILGPYKDTDDGVTLLRSLTVVCNLAYLLGYTLTCLGARYRFSCPSSVTSLTLIPEVNKVTDSWGQRYQRVRLLVPKVALNKQDFFG